MERPDCLQPPGLPLGPFGLGPVDRLPGRGQHQPRPGVAQLDAARIPGEATRIRIARSAAQIRCLTCSCKYLEILFKPYCLLILLGDRLFLAEVSAEPPFPS